MIFKKFLIAIALTGICFGAAAQTKDYRDPGFKGSVAITDQLGVFVGGDVSLGYMFDRKNYLGGGVGAFVFPKDGDIPVDGNLFADYRHYFKDTKNSMFAGSKLGFSHAFNYMDNSGVTYHNGILLEPNFGWSWGLKSGHGLELSLGATLLAPVGESRTDKKVLAMPKISFGFSF